MRVYNIKKMKKHILKKEKELTKKKNEKEKLLTLANVFAEE